MASLLAAGAPVERKKLADLSFLPPFKKRRTETDEPPFFSCSQQEHHSLKEVSFFLPEQGKGCDNFSALSRSTLGKGG